MFDSSNDPSQQVALTTPTVTRAALRYIFSSLSLNELLNNLVSQLVYPRWRITNGLYIVGNCYLEHDKESVLIGPTILLHFLFFESNFCYN